MDNERAAGPIVFVIDDDPNIRTATELLLSSAGFRVSTFASAEEFLQIPIPKDSPRCLLLDLRMHGLSGLGLQQRLSDDGQTIPIIFVTGFGSVPTAVDAIRAGAIDFLEKPFHRDALLDRVKRAVDIDAQSLMLRKQVAEFRSCLDTLSRRERDVLQLILGGSSNKEIAATLGIGIPTVTKHRSGLLRKLRVRNVFELISMVSRYDSADAGNNVDRRSSTPLSSPAPLAPNALSISHGTPPSLRRPRAHD
jgi:FixJ family two-component response regulator